MTRDDANGYVYANLADLPGVHWTPDDIRDAFDDCMELLSLFTCYIDKWQAVTTTPRNGFLNLDALVERYYRVLAVYDNTQNQWLEPVRFKEIKQDFRWRRTSGSPIQFSVLGYRHIVIWPVPPTAHSLTVCFNQVEDKIAGNVEIPISARHHAGVVDYMTGDLLQQDLELENAIGHLKLFWEHAEKLKIEYKSRPWGDRILALCQQFLAMPISNT